MSPGETKIKLQCGARLSVPVEATVAPEVPAGDYAVPLKLIRSDGTVDLECSVRLEHLGPRGRVVLSPIEDAYVGQAYPERNTAAATVLLVDGGDRTMGDHSHNLAYLKFRLDIPGKPESVRLRIRNAGNPTGDSGRVCLVTEPWSESKVTYRTQPKTGRELAKLGPVSENQVVQCRLPAQLGGKGELSLVIDPTSCDGVDYLSRESGKPAELIVEYVPGK